ERARGMRCRAARRLQVRAPQGNAQTAARRRELSAPSLSLSPPSFAEIRAMGMTQTKVAGKGQATPNINVTPLVDVVLVVLIIFMILTITMSKTFSLHLPPKDDTAKDEPKPASGENQPVVMTVDASGVIRVNQTIVPKSELRERLPRMLAGANQRVLYF